VIVINAKSTSKLIRTRIIPISDYYTRLQLEYLSYRIRAAIYQRAFDKKKFTEICKKKREKIEQIALENCLPSIFNNTEQQRKYMGRFFGQTGFPNFCYRDDYQQSVKGYWDLYYYFIKGASVRFTRGTSTDIGHIKDCSVKEKKVRIIVDGRVIERKFEEVSRIFPSDFFVSMFL